MTIYFFKRLNLFLRPDVIYAESKVNSFHDVRLVQVKYYGKHVNAASRETRRIRVVRSVLAYFISSG